VRGLPQRGPQLLQPGLLQPRVKNALKLKEINPEMDVYILFRDMRTYGFKRTTTARPRTKRSSSSATTPEDPPRVEAARQAAEDVLRVDRAPIPFWASGWRFDADGVPGRRGGSPSGPPKDRPAFQGDLSPDDFFKEAHVKLRPVEFAADGVFLCGTAHYPKHIPETINQAYGAAGRVLTCCPTTRWWPRVGLRGE
jgi:heterodisulfide reductase subunit A